MTKSQRELAIKIMVSKAIPTGGAGAFIREIIFHDTTTVNWDKVAELISAHFPELRKRVEEINHENREYEVEYQAERRRLKMPRKKLSEVFDSDLYTKTKGEPGEWKVGDEGINPNIPDAKKFLVIAD